MTTPRAMRRRAASTRSRGLWLWRSRGKYRTRDVLKSSYEGLARAARRIGVCQRHGRQKREFITPRIRYKRRTQVYPKTRAQIDHDHGRESRRRCIRTMILGQCTRNWPPHDVPATADEFSYVCRFLCTSLACLTREHSPSFLCFLMYFDSSNMYFYRELA